MRDNLLAIVENIKALLNEGLHREKIEKELAILPVEALKASRQLRIAGCTPQEKVRLGALVRALQTLATRTLVLVSGRQAFPGMEQAFLRPPLERLEVKFQQMLSAFAECLRQGDCRRTLPNLNDANERVGEGTRKRNVRKPVS
jgi:hypothetical protein